MSEKIITAEEYFKNQKFEAWHNQEEKNEYYDYLIVANHQPYRYEVKTRSELYDDILIELIQYDNIINKTSTSSSIHKGIGWFYKTDCDRLLYIMPGYAYDFEWKKFKRFITKYLHKFGLVYSGKTTGSYNISVPIKNIPKNFYNRFDYN